jgi:intein/homing endonuclease
MELFAEIAPDGARRYDSVRATLSSQRWARFFLQFGNTAPYKRMPLWLKSISLRQMGIMLKSMYKGDGSVMDRTTRKDFTIVYGSSSPSLTYDLAQCLSRYGIFGTISYRRPEQIPLRMLNGSPVIARHTQHSICVGGEASRVLAKLIEVNQPKWKAKATGYWNRDGHLWAKAQKVEEMDYDGSVVNFSVEEDESFVADGIVTHNCGTSTTGMVAIRRGRNYIGIELNAKYIEMSKKRLQQGENRRGFGF